MPGALILVGCGKMGSALLGGWAAVGAAETVYVIDPNASPPTVPGRTRVVFLADPAGLPIDLAPTAVILAVKPQLMGETLPAYQRFADRALFLSIAAGKPLAWFGDRLGKEAAIVRAMPNTPAAIGRGISVAVANGHVGEAGRSMADRLLSAVGEVAWVDDESLLDAVTAVSGSGPAYVFLLVETLAKAGVAAGLPIDLARRLARRTVEGAGELLRQSPEDPDQLRRNVTSPKGTTQAALDVLMADDGMAPLLERAVMAGTRRSRELAD